MNRIRNKNLQLIRYRSGTYPYRNTINWYEHESTMMAVNGTTKPCLCSSWGEIMSSQFRELRNLRGIHGIFGSQNFAHSRMQK